MKIKIPRQVEFIIKRLNEYGYEAFAVGGCVRDVLMGREPHDWDITTSAKPEEIKSIFKRTVDTGIEHGTVTVLLDCIGFEVTTYRIDGEYEDGRHPKEVVFTSNLKEDLKRRDFTINAMAYSPDTGIVDLFGGKDDLQKKIIRCVGSPEERFDEDALRIMRAVRFAAQLGFSIEDKTFSAVKNMAPNLKKISAERIQAELSKLLVSDHPENFRMLYDSGITKIIMPEFDEAMECPQNTPYHKFSVGEHTLSVIENVKCTLPLRLAAVMHDLGKCKVRTTDENGRDHFKKHEEASFKIANSILKRLKYDKATMNKVDVIVKYHDYRIELDEKSVRRAINKIGEDNYIEVMEFQRADAKGKADEYLDSSLKAIDMREKLFYSIMEKNQCISLKTLAVNGKDLINEGVKPGKELGDILGKMLEHVIDNPECNDKKILIDWWFNR